jgi:two-component system sensor histidine kinase ArlS
MTKKLLHKTLNYYFIYALLVLLSIGPAFYVLSDVLFENDADEDLMVVKHHFTKFTVNKLTLEDIKFWNDYNQDIKIEKYNGILRDTLFDRNFYDSLNKENEPFRVLQSPIKIQNKPYTFTAKMNMVGKENLTLTTALLFVILLMLLISGFFIITKIISKTIWRPFYIALDKIERFEIDKERKIQLVSSTTEEFERLNSAIENLIQKNTQIYKSQKEFIENAAHELQTPIAIFKGKLDTLLQRDDITEGQSELLGELNDTTTRLSRLNKNLLLLSKIEIKQYNIPEEVNLNEVITKQLDFFKEQALSKNITVNTNLKNDSVVKTNAFLAEILISNLFLNAINHNVEKGVINVGLNANSLIFSNSGIETSLETNKLFERFSKVNPSSKGNGLGLSIINKIVANNNWSIDYNFRDKMHFFEVHF